MPMKSLMEVSNTMDHHQELYELNQQNEEAEYHQWELEQQEQEEEYMTGWEILASIFLFVMIFGTAWLFLLITY